MVEYNGKIYMTDGGEGGWTFRGNFYSMNLDGTGFQKLFSVTHNWCSSFAINCVQDGYIYYQAITTKDKTDSLEGNFKIKLDGTGRTDVVKRGSAEVISNGKTVFYTLEKGIAKLSASGQKTTFSVLADTDIHDLASLYNGYLLAYADKETYIVSDSGSKAYKLSDFSPADPYAGLKHGFSLVSNPTKTSYQLGEGFDPTGFEATYFISARRILEELTPHHSSISFYTSNTVQLTQGRPFTTPGKKVVEIRYDGKKVAEYTIQVKEASQAPAEESQAPAEESQAPKETSTKSYEVVASGGYDGAPYRDAPNGDIIGTIPAGTIVELLGKSGSDWGLVAYDGGEYYVWFARLKKVS